MNLRQVRPIAPIMRKISLGIIIACLAIVTLHLTASALFNPKAMVDREIDMLARDYYESFIYKNITNNLSGDSLEQAMKTYEKSGTGEVYLRQLLLFDNGKHQESAKVFNYQGYTCDTNKTYVKFYSDEPYSIKDYHFDINLVCE